MKQASAVLLIAFSAIFCEAQNSVNDDEPTPKSQQLNEIVVSAARIIKASDGHITALPNKEEKRHSFGGIDLLANMMIPGVTVNRSSGKVSAVFGDVALYINGIKATLQEVKALNARDVLRVEYYDTPTGVYIGENAVINYVVREHTTGYFGEVSADQKLGYWDGTYGFASKLSHNNTSVQLIADYNFKRSQSDIKTGYTNYGLADGNVREDIEGIDGKTNKDIGNIYVDVTNKTKDRTLRGSAWFNATNTPYSIQNELVNGSVQSKKTIDNLCLGGLRLFQSYNLQKKQTIEVNAGASFTRNDYSYLFENTRSNIFSESSNRLWNMDFTAVYNKPFSRGNSLAVKFIDLYKNSRVDYKFSNIDYSTLWSNEEILFIQYVHPLSKTVTLTVQPGFSALQYKQDSREPISTFSPRLGVRCSVRLPRNMFLMGTVNVGNSFPNIAGLTTAEKIVNDYLVIRGNPDIKNTKLYQTMWVYGWNTRQFGLQVMAQYQYNHNLPVSSYQQEGNRIVESWTTDENAGYFNSNVSLTYRPLQNISLMLARGHNRYDYTGYRSANVGSFDGKFEIVYYWRDFSISGNVTSPQKLMGMDLAKVRTPWQYGLALGYAVTSWKFEAGVNNPFLRDNNYRFVSFNPAYNYDYSLRSHSSGCHGYVKVTFSFDGGKKLQRTELKH
ncbi:MAG: hypothetical protein K2N10_07130, partial [Muribaculaceae bacterium]|nr:hypothetical protein [Muribaculaceae bacterium]